MTLVRPTYLLLLCGAALSATIVNADEFFFEGVMLVEAEAATAGRGGGMGGRMGGMAPEQAAVSSTVPVQFFMPAKRTSDVAIVLIPGGGLPSWSYTNTPDGREGWAQQFARAGIPVYLMNPPTGTREELGRWNKESVWPLWGIGPEYGKPFDDSKFPLAAIDTLQSSFFIARAGGGAAHVAALLDQIGPAVVLGHSAGGGATFSTARAEHPNLRGTIAVETTNCPTNAELLRKVYVDGERAFLSIWGDNLDRGAPSMRARYETCRTASDLISAAGGNAVTYNLPEDMGITGNTHLLMQDTNNVEIGALIISWLADALCTICTNSGDRK